MGASITTDLAHLVILIFSDRLRTLQRDIKTLKIETVRKNSLTLVQQVAAIEAVQHDDHLGKWGSQHVKGKLARKGILIPRSVPSLNLSCVLLKADSRAVVEDYNRMSNLDAVALRHPKSKKIHRKGLISIGLNEEWGGDFHDKVWNLMGLAIYAWIDKFSRRIFGMWCFGRKTADVPVGCYILVAQKVGGIPIRLTSDKGSETGKVASLQRQLR